MIHLVTDSTSDLTGLRDSALGVRVVPLTVRFGEEQFRDGVDLTSREFYQRLADSSVNPTTSQPAPQAFVDVFHELLRPDDHIVSLHIAQQLSGTLQSATLAARDVDEARIFPIDSGTVSVGLQLLIEAAARDIAAGADLGTVLHNIEERKARICTYVLLDTLTYLQRGGRIGRAQAMLGGMLKVKPLLRVEAGEVHPQGKVRSRTQGIEALVELAKSGNPIEAMGVMHADAPDAGTRLRERLVAEFPGMDASLGELGPVVGTYTGGGALGFACMTAAAG